MQEILRSDTEIAIIPIPVTGSILSALATAYDMDTLEQVYSASVRTTSSAGVVGLYLDENASSYDRKIKVVTSGSLSTGSFSSTIFYELNRPFATVSDIRTLTSVSSSVTDAKLTATERLFRLYIQSEVLENFYRENKVIVAYGEDSDTLYLDKRILTIDYIYENDILIYTGSADPQRSRYLLETDVDKYQIKTVAASYSTDTVFEHTGIYLVTYDGIFKRDTKYTIQGTFGWDYVPSDIQIATTMMVEDWFCRDISVRNKNIQRLQTDSYTVQYANGFQDGSGNLLADHIIQKYKSLRISPRII
jgi:hypothetical protein